MEFNYDAYFNTNDVISISKEDVDYILSGDNPVVKETKGKDVDEVKKLMANGNVYKGLDQAILYIKSNQHLTLYDQSQILECLRDLAGNELNIIYGVGIDEAMEGISVLVVASKIKA